MRARPAQRNQLVLVVSAASPLAEVVLGVGVLVARVRLGLALGVLVGMTLVAVGVRVACSVGVPVIAASGAASVRGDEPANAPAASRATQSERKLIFKTDCFMRRAPTWAGARTPAHAYG